MSSRKVLKTLKTRVCFNHSPFTGKALDKFCKTFTTSPLRAKGMVKHTSAHSVTKKAGVAHRRRVGRNRGEANSTAENRPTDTNFTAKRSVGVLEVHQLSGVGG